MTDNGFDFENEVKTLRSSFDESFSRPAGQEGAEHINCLVIKLHDDRFVLNMSEIKSIENEKQIIPLPNSQPHLLGISNIQGKILPVFCLEMLLGYQGSKNSKWLVTCGNEETIALAFEEFEGQISILKKSIFLEENESDQAPKRGAVILGDQKGSVLRISVILDTVKRLSQK